MRALWLLGLCLVSVTGSAQASPYLARDNPLLALLPSASALHARACQRLEAQLTRAIGSLPGVEHAEIALRLPDPAALALDQPLPKPSANLLLDVRAPGPSDADLIGVVHSALPELQAEQVRILRHHVAARPPGAARARTVRVGPFAVAPESATLLRASLGVCLAANALLAALVLARFRAR